MAWTIVEGPIDARAEIPEGRGRGDFDGDVYRFHIERDGDQRTVHVRFRGTLVEEDLSRYPEELRKALATQGRSEVESRLVNRPSVNKGLLRN
jgi:hypothetical protein